MECTKDGEFHLNEKLEMRCRTMHSNIENFYSLANLGDISAAYRNRPIWTSFSSTKLVEAVVNLLVEVPASRHAIFNFLANMIHEATHLCLLKRESSLININCENLEKAVCILIDKLRIHSIELNKQSFIIDLLNWHFQVFSDLAQQNALRPAMSGRNLKSTILLEIFMQCLCASDLISLFNVCFANLLQTSPNKAIEILVDSANFGEKSDWIWVYVANTFASEVVSYLMNIGVDEFRSYCHDFTTQQVSKSRILHLNDECNFKLRSFILFFDHLAKKRNPALQHCILQIVKDFFKNDDVAGMLFLIKLFLTQFNIFEFVIDDLVPYLSTYAVLQIILLAQNPFLQVAIVSKSVVVNFLKCVASAVDVNTAVLISEALLPIVCDESTLKRISNLGEPFCCEIREELGQLLVCLNLLFNSLFVKS